MEKFCTNGCFTPESLVLMSDNVTYKMIKDIQVGELIMSLGIDDLSQYSDLSTWTSGNFSGIRSLSTVTEVVTFDITDGYYIINDVLNTTSEHLILVKRDVYKFVSVENIVIGDYLYNTTEDLFVPVTSKVFVPYSGPVYNLILDMNLVYFVSGILVHYLTH